ncbi:DinB family protein [Bacillus pinisoli]|uniref:DinB family protein n=1 Tax=Bacillus pinisoli TaxID=2901866 RepID=UPI001FF697B9|nr:DinB family protein [Bacillus pinisoli]
MNKEELLKAKREVLHWVEQLEDLDENTWFQPLSEGKWAIADVLSHFISWDRFCMDYRLPYMEKSIPFPKLDVNVDHVNRSASVYARSGITKSQLIHEYKETRTLLLDLLEERSEESFSRIIKLGAAEMTVAEYLQSYIEHDQAHIQKVSEFLNKTITSSEPA